MDRKLLFFDVDGTLITEDEIPRLPESAREALLEAKSRGHYIFVNSGRTWYIMDKKVREVPFDGYMCGCGTEIIYRGQSIFHRTIPKDRCLELSEYMQKNKGKLHVVFEGSSSHYFDMEDTYKNVLWTREICKEIDPAASGLKDWKDADISFDKFVIFSSDRQALDNVKSVFPEFTYIDRSIPGRDSFYEVVPDGYSKGTAIQYMCDYLNLPLENCYVFGDSTNDLPMLNYVRHSVAMGNAAPDIKDQVSFVTKAVDDDGIAYALKYLGLI